MLYNKMQMEHPALNQLCPKQNAYQKSEEEEGKREEGIPEIFRTKFPATIHPGHTFPAGHQRYIDLLSVAKQG